MDFGTWADWANVAGSIIVGGAVIYLGWKANHIADLPRQLAQEAEEREGRLLLKFLEENLAATRRQAHRLEGFVKKRLPADVYINDQNRRVEFFAVSRGLKMNYAPPILSRLHTAGAAGDRIVESVSICMRIATIAQDGQHQATSEISELRHLQLTQELRALVENLDAVLLGVP